MPEFDKALVEMNERIRDAYRTRTEHRKQLIKHTMAVTSLEACIEADSVLIDQWTAAVAALGGTPAVDPDSPEGLAEYQRRLEDMGIFGISGAPA